MADNYLESRYEEYLKRKAALEAAKKHKKKTRPIASSEIKEKRSGTNNSAAID